MKGYFVYCLCAENCDAVYIGSTINLTDRVKSHIYHNKAFSKVFYLVCESEEQMLLLEKQFISKFKPTYNKIMYSVDPFDGEVYWSELDKSEFTYYLQQREYGSTQRVCPVLERANSAILYYCVDKGIMKLRHLYSKICIDNNTPQRVEFSASDKLIYTYMKTRYDFCIALEEDYMETRQDIASAIGVDVKTVSRFTKKMKTHGFIDYSTNNLGNRVLYKFILDLV